MAGENNGSNSAAATASKIQVETLPTFPGFGPAAIDSMDLSNYRVRYSKIDTDDPGSIAELEILETKGLAGKEIVVLKKESWTFMDKFFILVSYLELIENT